MVGYELWLKEYGVVANMVRHAPFYLPDTNGSLEGAGFDPRKAIPGPTLGSHLKDHRVETMAYQPASIVNSSLTKMLMRDVAIRGYQSLEELWISLRNDLDSPRDQPIFYFMV